LLPVGVCDTADLSGFVAQAAGLMVTVGQTIALRFEMAVSGVAETVTVAGDSPSSDGPVAVSSITEASVRPAVGGLLHRLCLLRRICDDARHQPPAACTLNSLVDARRVTRSWQTVGHPARGVRHHQFSQGRVKSFSRSTRSPQMRPGGAVINVVTKSGTNSLRGSIFEFYRDKALNANNAINELNGSEVAVSLQFGGTLGG
jgi:hypothetical protein